MMIAFVVCLILTACPSFDEIVPEFISVNLPEIQQKQYRRREYPVLLSRQRY